MGEKARNLWCHHETKTGTEVTNQTAKSTIFKSKGKKYWQFKNEGGMKVKDEELADIVLLNGKIVLIEGGK